MEDKIAWENPKPMARVLYRCDGKKCAADKAMPMCFFTSDENHRMKDSPAYAVEKDGKADMEEMKRLKKDSAELAEYQTFLPVEKRMECKKLLPVFDLGEEAEGDAEVQP